MMYPTPSKASSPVGGYGPIWYLLELLEFSQKAKPFVSNWHLPVKPPCQASLQTLGKNRPPFLPTIPTSVETHSCLSQAWSPETKVRLAGHTRHLHPGSCKHNEAIPLVTMAAVFLISVSNSAMKRTSRKPPLISRGRTELSQDCILLSLTTGQLHWQACTPAAPRRERSSTVPPQPPPVASIQQGLNALC